MCVAVNVVVGAKVNGRPKLRVSPSPSASSSDAFESVEGVLGARLSHDAASSFLLPCVVPELRARPHPVQYSQWAADRTMSWALGCVASDVWGSLLPPASPIHHCSPFLFLQYTIPL